jgi:hypothetical protein
MTSAQKSHGSTYSSPEGCRTLAGSNTPGSGKQTSFAPAGAREVMPKVVRKARSKLMQVKAGYCSLLQAIFQKKIFYRTHASWRSVNGGRPRGLVAAPRGATTLRYPKVSFVTLRYLPPLPLIFSGEEPPLAVIGTNGRVRLSQTSVAPGRAWSCLVQPFLETIFFAGIGVTATMQTHSAVTENYTFVPLCLYCSISVFICVHPWLKIFENQRNRTDFRPSPTNFL